MNEPGDFERVALYGRYGVFAPYQSHDGPVAWTVHRVEPDADPEEGGYWLAEFDDRHDAELFAEAKFESEDSARLDKIRDSCESEDVT